MSDLPCYIRREVGQSLVIGASSLVILEGKPCNPLLSLYMLSQEHDTVALATDYQQTLTDEYFLRNMHALH